jgi:hypothetical protein
MAKLKAKKAQEKFSNIQKSAATRAKLNENLIRVKQILILKEKQIGFAMKELNTGQAAFI